MPTSCIAHQTRRKGGGAGVNVRYWARPTDSRLQSDALSVGQPVERCRRYPGVFQRGLAANCSAADRCVRRVGDTGRRVGGRLNAFCRRWTAFVMIQQPPVPPAPAAPAPAQDAAAPALALAHAAATAAPPPPAYAPEEAIDLASNCCQ